jgi:CDP-diacylglycerol--serine O-phosphatidyltransferase
MDNPQDTETKTGGPTPHPFKMMKLKDYITLLGTVFGILAIWVCIYQDLQWITPLLIFFGTGCDLLDGYVARKLHQHNEIGGELDSLSDVIVFSVAPAFLMYNMYAPHLLGTWGYPFLVVATVAFVCFGVIRLAWFNISKTAEGYVGLVVPVGALYLVVYYVMNRFWDIINLYPSLNAIIYAIAPFFVLLVGFLEIAPFLTYDKAVKKKQGTTKIAIFISAGVGLVVVICGLILYEILYDIAIWVTFLAGIAGFLMITTYILIGFRNWLHLYKAKK